MSRALFRPHAEEHPCKSIDLHGCFSKHGPGKGRAAPPFETAHANACALLRMRAEQRPGAVRLERDHPPKIAFAAFPTASTLSPASRKATMRQGQPSSPW